MNGNYGGDNQGYNNNNNNNNQMMDQNQYTPYPNMQNHQFPQGMMGMPNMQVNPNNIIQQFNPLNQ